MISIKLFYCQEKVFIVMTNVGICHSINGYAKANNKYMKDYDKKNCHCHILNIGMQIILYDWAIKQNLLLNGSEWVKDISEFYEGFLKGNNEESGEKYFLLEADI